MRGRSPSFRRTGRASVVVGTLLAISLSAETAGAWCRQTTCDPKKGPCPANSHHCYTSGEPLVWAEGAITVWVDPKGSPLRKIGGDDAAFSLAKAFTQWETARCGDGTTPSVSVTVLSGSATPPEDAQVAVYFRDDHWPYSPTYGALTHLEFDPDTGDLVSALMEIDSAGQELTVNADGGGIDFDAVITHETGHVLGLAHSDVPGATMVPESSGFGSVELATLDPDDKEGICAIYGPGFSPEEEESVPPPSCGVGRGATGATAGPLGSFLCLLALGLRRTRSGS